MSNREIVIDLVGKLPEDTPMEEIAREIELLAGIKIARDQARKGEGIPAEDARRLIEQPGKRIAPLHPGAWEVREDFDQPLSEGFWMGKE
jgi:hypothetical protein